MKNEGKRVAAIGLWNKKEKRFDIVGEIDVVFNGNEYKVTVSKQGDSLHSPPSIILNYSNIINNTPTR